MILSPSHDSSDSRAESESELRVTGTVHSLAGCQGNFKLNRLRPPGRAHSGWQLDSEADFKLDSYSESDSED